MKFFLTVSKEMEPTLKNSLLLHMLVQRLEDLVTHLGCFSMALSAVLSTEHKLTPDIIKTNATISVAKVLSDDAFLTEVGYQRMDC